ncbi:hypothetical protein MCHI_001470 [Candidatus Magnetoovum chiemensis]|nr:hypothetical protein MCHI_001470 [Candidatus Magnetoovum chiemensis]
MSVKNLFNAVLINRIKGAGDINRISGNKERHKKRQALNVIPMSVSDE